MANTQPENVLSVVLNAGSAVERARISKADSCCVEGTLLRPVGPAGGGQAVTASALAKNTDITIQLDWWIYEFERHEHIAYLLQQSSRGV